ncbi:DarT1-associated NADAR antitoxin family protein [Rhodovulum sp. PH10]|uniref:DarT1-associated NADAR antitoxin family protein n=1 Tax=Rhodovulum sp. PH10 TaxID=1187851 RepID=UPI00058ED4FC|nr:hypothetical protein [Rhodovulum sp. PH10]
MAERPIFIPAKDAPGFVKEISLSIPWASGFAPVQKKKNIKALHEAAAQRGFEPLLEVSTKSDVVAGQHLSAFHLKVQISKGEIPLESAFQGSKVFERGGPYTDLYEMDPRTAKRDPRLQESGRLIRFEYEGHRFPLHPATVFYDWLYLTAIYPHREWLNNRLTEKGNYAGFTDIEFNPSKSINCQARSCALFIALMQKGLLEGAIKSPESFVTMMKEQGSSRIAKESDRQLSF